MNEGRTKVKIHFKIKFPYFTNNFNYLNYCFYYSIKVESVSDGTQKLDFLHVEASRKKQHVRDY